MKVVKTKLEGVFIIEPDVYQDSRGYFFESYNKQKLEVGGIAYDFVQDNQSKSSHGAIRGLHFQKPPHAQTKLVRVVSGKILDVSLDIRKSSPTYGQHVAVELTDENNRQLLIPVGFAHGFSVLSDIAVVQYKCTDYYYPSGEGGLIYNDSTLDINWRIPENKILVSEKDLKLPTLSEFSTPF